MFSLFNKKDRSVKVKDIIWMNSTAKWQGVVDLWKKNENTVFIFWFDETLQQAQRIISGEITGNINLFTTKEIHYQFIENKSFVFTEHYPLKKKEQELFQSLHLEEVKVFSALDEPLFRKFGSDKIVRLMQQIGMKENESIEHNMITKAVQNVQEKIAKQVGFEQSAQSQDHWIEKNLSR